MSPFGKLRVSVGLRAFGETTVWVVSRECILPEKTSPLKLDNWKSERSPSHDIRRPAMTLSARLVPSEKAFQTLQGCSRKEYLTRYKDWAYDGLDRIPGERRYHFRRACETRGGLLLNEVQAGWMEANTDDFEASKFRTVELDLA